MVPLQLELAVEAGDGERIEEDLEQGSQVVEGDGWEEDRHRVHVGTREPLQAGMYVRVGSVAWIVQKAQWQWDYGGWPICRRARRRARRRS